MLSVREEGANSSAGRDAEVGTGVCVRGCGCERGRLRCACVLCCVGGGGAGGCCDVRPSPCAPWLCCSMLLCLAAVRSPTAVGSTRIWRYPYRGLAGLRGAYRLVAAGIALLKTSLPGQGVHPAAQVTRIDLQAALVATTQGRDQPEAGNSGLLERRSRTLTDPPTGICAQGIPSHQRDSFTPQPTSE